MLEFKFKGGILTALTLLGLGGPKQIELVVPILTVLSYDSHELSMKTKLCLCETKVC